MISGVKPSGMIYLNAEKEILVTRTVNLDYFAVEKAKDLRLNMSKICREALKEEIERLEKEKSEVPNRR